MIDVIKSMDIYLYAQLYDVHMYAENLFSKYILKFVCLFVTIPVVIIII